MKVQHHQYRGTFVLERGGTITDPVIGYMTWGQLNDRADNVIWVCHALTANADAADWWNGMIGPGKMLDTDRYYIVCANILGSCYGSTGPLDINPDTGKAYYHNFPALTIRDMVKAHIILSRVLKISVIYMVIGGSMGGYQALEWSLMEQSRVQNMVLIATSARESAWGKAIHYIQQRTIALDPSWHLSQKEAGQDGMRLARATGLLTYRNYHTFCSEQDGMMPDGKQPKVVSYLRHQGEKLAKRFNAFSYDAISRAQDTHDISRNRSALEKTLAWIRARTLIINIDTDILYPLPDQELMARHIPGSRLERISSPYGHDGFLVETQQISRVIAKWLEEDRA